MRRKAGEKVEITKLGMGAKKMNENASKGSRRNFTEIVSCKLKKKKKSTTSRTRLEHVSFCTDCKRWDEVALFGVVTRKL